MKIKEFYQKHKKAVWVTAAGVAVGTLVYIKATKVDQAAKAVAEVAKDAPKPAPFKPIVLKPTEKLKALGFDGIDEYTGVYESMTDYGLKVKDLGTLGEALQELDRIGPDNNCFILFNVLKSEGNTAEATAEIAAKMASIENRVAEAEGLVAEATVELAKPIIEEAAVALANTATV